MSSSVSQLAPSVHALSRMLCLAAVVYAACLTPAKFNLFVIVIGFMHYMLAMVYSRRRLVEIMSDFRTATTFVLVTAGGFLCWFFKVPIAWLSIVHHNFNEVYMRDTFQERNRQTKVLRLSCVVLNSFLFCAILRHDPGLRWIDHRLLFGGVIISALWYLSVLVSCRRQFTVRQLIDNSIYEIASFGLLALSLVKPVNIMHMFLYHFLFWEAYPLPKMLRSGRAAVTTYIGWHLVFIPVALLVSPVNPAIPQLGLTGLFMFFGYIHNAISLGLSSAQPTWVIRLFGPAPGTRPALATATIAQAQLAGVGK